MEQKVDMNFRDRDLVFVDLETTGLYVETHEIIEIGALLVDHKTLEIKDEYYKKVIPEHLELATKEALDMNIYREEEWNDAIDIKTALKQFSIFAGSSMIAGWKVDFDFHFLTVQYRKQNLKYKFDYHLVDVSAMAYLFFKEKKTPEKLSLREICKIYNIELSDQHGAMVDIKATYAVFKQLLNEFKLS